MKKQLSVFVLAIVLLLPLTATAADWHELPDGICAKYAAAEFEKIAPAPGVNWLKYNYDWVLQASEAGWHVTTAVRDARVGAVVEWQSPERKNGHVAIVRQVFADRIIVEENNVGKTVGERKFEFGGKHCSSGVTEGWGKTTMRSIKYDEMMQMDKRVFMGYIWPVRKDDYAKNPQKYQTSMSELLAAKEPKYKGFTEYWGPAMMLKEFDKVAPAPGADWSGNVEKWVSNAKERGWVTQEETAKAMEGALLIRCNPEKKLVKVSFVRSIDKSEITLESRDANLYQRSKTVKISEIKQTDEDGYRFIGYIWPLKS